MRLTASVAVACGLLLTVPALAATVDSLRGQVAINRGEGFRRITGPTQANIGDSVMVSPNGRARVVYPDGCAINVDRLPSGCALHGDCAAMVTTTPGSTLIAQPSG